MGDQVEQFDGDEIGVFCNQLKQLKNVGIVNFIVNGSTEFLGDGSAPILDNVELFGDNLNEIIEGLFGGDALTYG